MPAPHRTAAQCSAPPRHATPPYLSEPAVAMKPYLPVYAASNVVNGKIAAMPAFANAMFMCHCNDLLAKHGVAEPKTFKDDKDSSVQVQAGRDAAAGDGQRQERHWRGRLAVGGQRLQQAQGRCDQAGEVSGATLGQRGQQVSGRPGQPAAH